MKTLSERLRYLIDKKKITSYYLSNETSISEATLSRLLNETSAKPSIKTLNTLANYFNVEKDWLLTGDGEMLKELKQNISDVSGSLVGSNINGNGNNITNNEVTVITKLVDSYKEIIREKDTQITNLISIIDKLSGR